MITTEAYSCQVLRDCIDLQKRKSADYQNPNSKIRQADHYPNGAMTILDMTWQKMIRLYSLLEAYQSGNEPNFESMTDSAKDLINYASFLASYLEGKMDGQNLLERDILNQPSASVDETVSITNPFDRIQWKECINYSHV